MAGYADASSGNTDLLANQIFVRSKMMPEARWPKVTDTDDPMKDHLTGRSHITIKALKFFACEIPTNENSLWPTGRAIANPHRGNATCRMNKGLSKGISNGKVCLPSMTQKWHVASRAIKGDCNEKNGIL